MSTSSVSKPGDGTVNKLNQTITGKNMFHGSNEAGVNIGVARNFMEMSPLSSITASYQNVDFLTVPEPYKIA